MGNTTLDLLILSYFNFVLCKYYGMESIDVSLKYNARSIAEFYFLLLVCLRSRFIWKAAPFRSTHKIIFTLITLQILMKPNFIEYCACTLYNRGSHIFPVK